MIARVTPATVTAGKANTITISLAPAWQNARPGLASATPHVTVSQTSEHPLATVAELGKHLFVLDKTGQLLVSDRLLQQAFRSVHPQMLWQDIKANAGQLVGLDQQNTLHIMNIDETGLLHVAGRYTPGGVITDMLTAPDRVFLLLDKRRIVVLDISSPASPKLIAEHRLPQDTRYIRNLGMNVYVAAAGAELTLLEAEQSGKAIHETARYRLNKAITGLAVSRNHLYVAAGNAGITVLEINDRLEIRWIASHHHLGTVQRLVTSGQRAIIVNTQNELILMDVSRPRLPGIISRYRSNLPVADLYFAGHSALIATDRQAAWIDFRAIPPHLSNIDLDIGQGVNYGGQRRVAIQGQIAYVADWFSGIHLYDISRAQRPRLLASFHTPGSPKGIVIDGSTAYVADDDHGLQVIDISDPLHPRQLSHLQTNGLAYTPKQIGSRLYLASHRAGFQIIDIHNRSRPQLIGEYNTPGKAWSIDVQDDVAYVADDDSGLLVFDVSQPARPKQIGQFRPGGQAEEVLIRNNIAYVAFFNDGLYIIDVHQPATPKLIAHLSTPGNARGLDLDDNNLYIADWLAGIHIVDVSDPSDPKITGSYDTDGAAWGIRHHNGALFVMDWWGGFTVLRRDHQGRLLAAINYHRAATINDLAATGNFIFTANGNYGIQLFDIRNPLNPTWVTALEPGCRVQSIVGGGSLLFALCPHKLSIYDSSNPFQLQIARTVPLVADSDILNVRQNHILIGKRGHAIRHLRYRTDHNVELVQRIDIHADDFWLADNKLFAVSAGNHLLVYALNKSNRFKKWGSYKTKHPVDIVRARQPYVYIHEKGAGIRVLKLGDHTLTSAGHIELNHNVLDMEIKDRAITILDNNLSLWQFDIRDPRSPVAMSVYAVPPQSSSFALHNESAYLAGGTTLAAIRLLPSISFRPQKPGAVVARLPQAFPPGDYDLLLSARGEGIMRLPAVLSVATPKFSAPKITMEAFRKLLRREKSKGP